MVTAKLIGIEEEIRGIKVYVNYKIDGVSIPTNETYNGELVNTLWIGWWNILGKTNQQVLQWIRKNVEHQCDNHIKAKFKELKSGELIDTVLSQYINSEITKDFATIGLDTDNDGTVDKQYRIFDNGTFEEIV